MNRDYDDTIEFKQLLQTYEKAKQEGRLCYLDSDDFVDIAEYYLRNNEVEKTLDTVEDGLLIHHDDEYLLSLKTNALISMHSFEEAKQLMTTLNADNDPDVYYFKAQLACGMDDDMEAAQKWFRKWMKIEKSECDKMKDREEGNTRLREAFLHIIISIAELSQRDDISPYITYWTEHYLKVCGDIVKGDDVDYDIARTVHDADLIDLEIKLYTRYLDVNPYMPQGWAYLAMLQHVQNQVPESINSAEFALAIDPNDPHALLVHAQGCYVEKMYPQAVKSYQKYVDQTEDKTYYSVLGRCYILTDQKDKGYEYLAKARTYMTATCSKKNHQEFERAFIADSFMIGGFYTDALRLINLVLKTCPTEEFLMQKGRILLKKGNEDEAMIAYMDAFKCASDKTTLLMTAGADFYDLGFKEEALFCFTMASKQENEPLHLKAYPYIAYVCLDLNLKKQFEEYIELACKYSMPAVRNIWQNDLICITDENACATLKAIYAKQR
ncbi:MAG: hypothetical protein MJY95_04925 [Bacteroidaceae bacterium]|nr:hypothetical protein [Bacteroidaceae bacterium]